MGKMKQIEIQIVNIQIFFKRIRHERCLSMLTKCKYSNTHTDRPKKASEREEECADINDDMVVDRLE